MKRGYILTLDAIMALMVALAVMAMIVGIQDSIKTTDRVEFKRIHYVSEDALEALNKKGVLDQIGTEWALSNGNSSSYHWHLASNLSQKYLSTLIPAGMGYKVLIDDQIIYADERVPESSMRTETRSARMLSGYLPGKPVLGYVARAYFSQIKSKTTEKYVNMPFIVHGPTLNSNLEVVYEFSLPDDAQIVSGEWVLNKAGGNTADMYLNGVHVASLDTCTNVSSVNVTAQLKSGVNAARINLSAGQYEGSFIVVRYRTSTISEDLTFHEKLPYINSTETADCVCQTTPASCERDPSTAYCYHGYPCCDAGSHAAMFVLKVPINFRGTISSINGRIHGRGLNNFINVVLNSVPIKRHDFSYDATEYDYALNLSTEDFSDAGIDLAGLSGKDNWLDIYMDSDCATAYDSVALLDDSYIEVAYTPESAIGYGDVTFGKSSMLNDSEWDNAPYGFSSWNFSMSIPENAEIYDACVRAFYSCECGGGFVHYGMEAWSDGKSRTTLYEAEGPSGTEPVFYDGSTYHDVSYFHFPAQYVNKGGEERNVSFSQYSGDQSNMSIREGSVFFVNYRINAYVPYGDPKAKAAGSNLTIWYDSDQDGSADGSVYVSLGESPDGFDPEDDAVDDAIMRLLGGLNFYGVNPAYPAGSYENPIDVEITSDLSVESSSVGDVRSMWGPAVLKLVVWM